VDVLVAEDHVTLVVQDAMETVNHAVDVLVVLDVLDHVVAVQDVQELVETAVQEAAQVVA
jgi:hypothetical protein